MFISRKPLRLGGSLVQVNIDIPSEYFRSFHLPNDINAVPFKKTQSTGNYKFLGYTDIKIKISNSSFLLLLLSFGSLSYTLKVFGIMRLSRRKIPSPNLLIRGGRSSEIWHGWERKMGNTQEMGGLIWNGINGFASTLLALCLLCMFSI